MTAQPFRFDPPLSHATRPESSTTKPALGLERSRRQQLEIRPPAGKPEPAGTATVLTPDALAFVANLVQRFAPTIRELLATVAIAAAATGAAPPAGAAPVDQINQLWGMLPAGYNNAYQILQFPGYVLIHYEMIHEARIIPIDSRPPLPARHQLWNGDPRGHWEGDTLVVETGNFNDLGWISTSQAGGRIKGIRHTSKLRVVERFTRMSTKEISYTATVTDPEIYTQPWTVSFPLTADPNYRIYEYACHEGNYAMEGIMRGKRAEDGRKGQ